jgi:hypothetical protein
VVERDTTVLGTRRRVEAFIFLAASVVTWFAVAPHTGGVGLWPAVAAIAVGVLPATLGLVFLALPLWSRRWMPAAAAVLALVAFGCTEAGWGLAANFAKLWAAVFAGWAFLRVFEELSWVVLVAVIVPFVDALSVWRGPTHEVTTHHFAIYTDVSVAFLAPGGGAAYLGPPDILFYALFLASAVRWHLRPGWTWVATTGMYSLTLVIANAAELSGLPALPFLSFGFLLANADLLWGRLRAGRA